MLPGKLKSFLSFQTYLFLRFRFENHLFYFCNLVIKLRPLHTDIMQLTNSVKSMQELNKTVCSKNALNLYL